MDAPGGLLQAQRCLNSTGGGSSGSARSSDDDGSDSGATEGGGNDSGGSRGDAGPISPSAHQPGDAPGMPAAAAGGFVWPFIDN
jgi:hypothetical protein